VSSVDNETHHRIIFLFEYVCRSSLFMNMSTSVIPNSSPTDDEVDADGLDGLFAKDVDWTLSNSDGSTDAESTSDQHQQVRLTYLCVVVPC
jgi:hypothetical protein